MQKHFVALDSWRGIAAIAVAFGHFETSGYLSTLALASTSYRFVDFFFLLSGFVIAHSSGTRIAGGGEAWPFLVRRIARLWPLHLAILAAFAAYQGLLLAAAALGVAVPSPGFTGSFDPVWLPANIAMVQAWGVLPAPTWNEPAWSISAEFAAYLAFAGCYALFGRRGWLVFALSAAAATGWALADDEIMRSTNSHALVRCLIGFGAGVCVHVVWTRRTAWRIPAATLTEAALVVVTLSAVTLLPNRLGIACIPCFAATIFVFAFEQGRVSRFLSRGFWVYLGRRSYSIYLVHTLVLTGVLWLVAITAGVLPWSLGEARPGQTGIVAPLALADPLIFAFLALVVAVAHVTYRFVELPGQQFGRSLAARMKQPRAPHAAPAQVDARRP
jgi:peptidoglycan/LPS O-acetylase OafA/YrhL